MHPYGTRSYEPTELSSELKDGEALGHEAPPVAGREQRAARVLLDCIRALTGARSGAMIARVVRRAAVDLVEADGTAYFVREGDSYLCVDEDAYHPTLQDRRLSGTGQPGDLWNTKQQLVVADVLSDSRVSYDHFHGVPVRSMVLTPVRASTANALIAVFWSRPRQVTSEQLSALQDLADVTATAAENVELYAELERRVERRTLELRDANRDLEAFSYSVAHDLRAPLSAMLVTRSILERSYGPALDSQGVKLLRDIERSGKRMGELIGGLLQFARCARVELAKELVDLSSLAAGTVMALRQQHLSRQVQVRIEQGMKAHADPTLMEVVLANLLGNAFKYTKDRHPAEIEVGMKREDALSVFFVRDNGAGFDVASASDLFVPFKRFHPAHLFDGHGVGLATVSRIVDKHGGRVWAESSPGLGATFYFALPNVS
jgi:signal transduction histidine kinase